MAKKQPTAKPTWSAVKTQLATFDRPGLLGLIHDLYGAHKDNQTFLHTRLGVGLDVLEPYKDTLDRWLWPDVMRNQDTSVSKAKQAIASFNKALGDAAGLAELTTYYCECAAGFANSVGLDDAAYFDALVLMFEQALQSIGQMPETERDPLIARLDTVKEICQDFGFGVGDDIDSLLAEAGYLSSD